ncbi:MAG TPA: enoyl-CoA hydratase-related protein [Bacillota bacterium]|nr:enoyl-CoA hydratase-related protein [Bacillota bacterium]
MDEILRCSIDGPRMTVTLCRPRVHNALNAELIAAIDQAFREAAGLEAVRYVVLAGEGPSFCAGADLKWMQAAVDLSPEENRADAARLAAALEAIATCPKPVIARVHGTCLAGGMGLAAACDLAVAAPDAVFGLAEVRLGLVPAMIFPYLLRKVAPHQLLRVALTGERFGATRAREMGLINEAADDPDAMARQWGEQLLGGGPQALARVKALFRAVPGMSWAAARQHTVEVIAEVRAGSEAREGIQALLQKRRPRWAP